MKERLKIYITWLLLSLLIFNAGLGFFIFQFSVELNKNEIENFLSKSDESELILLRITDATSILRTGLHEIIYDGKRYDVKKELINNGEHLFYCIHDEKEERIVGAWKASLCSDSYTQNGKQDAHSFDITKHLIKDYYFGKSSLENQDSFKTDLVFVYSENILSHEYFSVITPPPEL